MGCCRHVFVLPSAGRCHTAGLHGASALGRPCGHSFAWVPWLPRPTWVLPLPPLYRRAENLYCCETCPYQYFIEAAVRLRRPPCLLSHSRRRSPALRRWPPALRRACRSLLSRSWRRRCSPCCAGNHVLWSTLAPADHQGRAPEAQGGGARPGRRGGVEERGPHRRLCVRPPARARQRLRLCVQPACCPLPRGR